MSSQLALPAEVSVSEIVRCQSFGRSLELCANAAGYESSKEIQHRLDGVDKAQLSRWLNDREGILYPKVRKLMDEFGNHIPFLWMAHDLGYDLSSFRKRESETELLLRKQKERADAAEAELAILRKYVSGLRPGDN